MDTHCSDISCSEPPPNFWRNQAYSGNLIAGIAMLACFVSTLKSNSLGSRWLFANWQVSHNIWHSAVRHEEQVAYYIVPIKSKSPSHRSAKHLLDSPRRQGRICSRLCFHDQHISMDTFFSRKTERTTAQTPITLSKIQTK